MTDFTKYSDEKSISFGYSMVLVKIISGKSEHYLFKNKIIPCFELEHALRIIQTNNDSLSSIISVFETIRFYIEPESMFNLSSKNEFESYLRDKERHKRNFYEDIKIMCIEELCLFTGLPHELFDHKIKLNHYEK